MEFEKAGDKSRIRDGISHADVVRGELYDLNEDRRSGTICLMTINIKPFVRK